MVTRLGVDVGGTFSDLVMYDESGQHVFIGKGLSTPTAPEQGVLTVITDAGVSARLADARLFLHGTTVGLNVLLERKGPAIGLLATRGFRDSLEIRRGERLAVYDPVWKPPPPLVPRALRLPIAERVRANGDVEIPIERDDVIRACQVFIEAGVAAVAIAFLNAYANPGHERIARDALREGGFEGDISMSHEVSGEYREYERTSTTVIDAYVRPRVVHYLRSLDADLRNAKFGGATLITRCGGGSLTFAEAEGRPFETIMSGPVAGVVGSADLCRRLGIDMAITADVGGTSFDTCLVIDGRPQLKHEGMIGGMPIQTAWVDVRSIGSGGGSIAYVDNGGLLQVGPQSAGASPGPACYGRGGQLPTVTDAALVLGMLPTTRLAGGLRLDADAASRAVGSLTTALSLSAERVAEGILRIAASHMADAIRSISLEQGHDPRTAALVTYGGAGPMFGTLLAQELEIRRIIVPSYPGNFSAWGLLKQDLTQSAAETSVRPLDDNGVQACSRVLSGLIRELEGRADQATAEFPAVDEASLDLRYLGQEYSLTIPVSLDPVTKAISADADVIYRAFVATYERTFGHSLTEPVEVVTVRATRRRILPSFDHDGSGASRQSGGPPESQNRAFSFSRRETVEFLIVHRNRWQEPLRGPAGVLEETATTYVDEGFVVSRTGDDAMVLEAEG